MPIHLVMVGTTQQKEEFVNKVRSDNPDAKIVVILGNDDSDEIGNSRLLMRFAPFLLHTTATERISDIDTHRSASLTALFSAFGGHQSSPIIFNDNLESSHRDYDEERTSQDDHTKRQTKQKTRIVRHENRRSLICNKGTAPFQHKKNFVRSKKTKPFR